MRIVKYETIVNRVKELCQSANFDLNDDVLQAFHDSASKERSETGGTILQQLIENAEVATEERIPMCQDTGTPVFIIELGQNVQIIGGTLKDAINEGVHNGYKQGLLRNSIVSNPLTREKSEKYNAPAIMHVESVKGEHITIHFSAKGGGSENMSQLQMLTPAEGEKGVIDFIIDTVANAGPNACPPLVVGIGIGGNFETCAYLAKKSLFRPINIRHEDEETALLETRLLDKINQLGIGPQGMGGDTTALDVKVETAPCHIAALPVAVNINCHASRHKACKI